MKSLLDQVIANNRKADRESTVASVGTVETAKALVLENDTHCPECNKEMKPVIGNKLPMTACLDCRIALPSVTKSED